MIGVVAPSIALEIPVEVKAKGLSTICFHPGGQGIDAARAIQEMGEESVLLGMNGGESGTVVKALLDSYHIRHQLVTMGSPTATVLKLTVDYREQQAFQIPQPRISRHESDDLYTAASLLIPDSKVLVYIGKPLEGMPEDFFSCLIREANSYGVKTIVDLNPEAMFAALEAHPTIIKPNVDQLRRFFSLGQDASIEELLRVADELRSRGARNVVLSNGDRGALALGDGLAWLFTAPKVEAVVESGAGDCMVSALAVGLAREMPLEDIVRMGVAAGCAKVLRHGLGTCRREVTQRLLNRVKVQRVR